MSEKKYVDNDVFRFRISLQDDTMDRTVYTKPFPNIIASTDEEFYDAMQKEEDLVEEKYFTKERIEELKEEFIRKIRDTENPFNICCVDRDGGYNVTEDELLDVGI